MPTAVRKGRVQFTREMSTRPARRQPRGSSAAASSPRRSSGRLASPARSADRLSAAVGDQMRCRRSPGLDASDSPRDESTYQRRTSLGLAVSRRRVAVRSGEPKLDVWDRGNDRVTVLPVPGLKKWYAVRRPISGAQAYRRLALAGCLEQSSHNQAATSRLAVVPVPRPGAEQRGVIGDG